MPTTNPVPSQDPSDLLFNAGKLDEVLNGTGTSFTDRLGTARRTVAGMNADFDAQLADAESDLNVYRADAAASAAEALGYLQTIRATSYGAYASDPATDPLGNPPTVGDEYFNTTSNLLKRWNGTTWQASDINTANLAAPSGSSLVGYIPAGTGAIPSTTESKLRETVSISEYSIINQGVSIVPMGTLEVPVGTHNLSDLQLSGTSLKGKGPGSSIKASGTTTALKLGYINFPSQWAKRRLSDLAINGNSKSSDGVTFSQPTFAELSGRWELERVTITGCKKAIHKPNGNIGNKYSDISLGGNDFGYYAVGQTSPIMHAGADIFDGGEINTSALAAIYIDSPQSGNGGTRIVGTIIEGNPGFGLFVKNWALSYLPLVLDGVWFEANATSPSVTINSTAYTPKDIYLENTAHAVIQNGILPNIQLVNSKVSAQNVFMNDSNTQITADASSVLIVDNANIDSGAHKCIVNSVANVNRFSGTGAACWLAPQRSLKAGVLAEKLQALPYNGAGPFVFSGTGTINGTSVADGRIFSTCCELTIPSGYTLVQPAVTTTADKWIVLTVDIKFVSGSAADFTFQCTDAVTQVSKLGSLVTADNKWKTFASIAKVSNAGAVRMFLRNLNASATTIRLSAWQIMQFYTQQEALDYYNNGAYYV